MDARIEYPDDFLTFTLRISFVMIALDTCSKWKLPGIISGNVSCIFHENMTLKLAAEERLYIFQSTLLSDTCFSLRFL